MKKLTRHYKRLRYTRLKIAVLVIIINIIMLPTFCKYRKDNANLFHVFLNGTEVGYLGDIDNLQDILSDARREVGSQSEEIVYAKADVSYESYAVVFAEVDSERAIKDRMVAILNQSKTEVLQHAYTVRIGEYTMNMASSDDVRQVLQAALNVYEDDDSYVAQLVSDPTRELNALTVSVITNVEAEHMDCYSSLYNLKMAFLSFFKIIF